LRELLQQLQEVRAELILRDDAEQLQKAYELIKEKYKTLRGQRAILYCSSTGEYRLVTIGRAFNRILILHYRTYGIEYVSKQCTTVRYSALISGEDRLELK